MKSNSILFLLLLITDIAICQENNINYDNSQINFWDTTDLFKIDPSNENEFSKSTRINTLQINQIFKNDKEAFELKSEDEKKYKKYENQRIQYEEEKKKRCGFPPKINCF